MFEMYMDFAMAVKERLLKEVNGRVWFDIYPRIDTVIFHIDFKDFKYNYGINDIQENIMTKSDYAEEITDILKNHYRKSVFNAFFKSDKHKERDEKKKLGIYLEEL